MHDDAMETLGFGILLALAAIGVLVGLLWWLLG
jgi:hypothetical protein